MSNQTTDNPDGQSSVLMSAIIRLLRPLVRLLLRQQVTWPVLAELIKSLYVDVAEKDFTLEGKKQSDSRLHVLTGIHRRDIKRFRETPIQQAEIPKNISIGSQAIAIWCHSRQYTDKRGKPVALPLQSDDGSTSFNALVSSISKDIRPRAILDEWLRIGLIQRVDKKTVKLTSEALVPRDGYEEKLYYLARNLHDHIAACDNNMQQDQPPMIERSVHYQSVPPDAVTAIQKRAEKLGMKSLKELDQMIRQLKKTNSRNSSKNCRINYGVYFYKEPSILDDNDE